MIGKRFAVDRITGVVIGGGAFWSFTTCENRVLAKGNSDNSFVAVSSSPSAGAGVHFTAVMVSEYTPGPIKPFIVMSNSQVASGTCE